MTDPAHTPYDGSATPFTIGLRPLETHAWIEVDERLGAFLAEKERHFAERFDAVFRAEEGTREAQAEVLEALADHLPHRFPDIYRREADAVAIAGTDRRVGLDAGAGMPLLAASRLVQEDLVLMRKGENGWRLAAASLCFPSSWSLAEKFGRPLTDIHIPVPGFGPGTRNATLIDRIFDKLQVDRPVQRLNWSLQEDARLHHPRSKSMRDETTKASGATYLGPEPAAAAFIRVERQTLRRMPRSGDILFTIRIHLDAMRVLATHADRRRLAASFADQLAALDGDQLAYKGLAEDRDRLVADLRSLAVE